MVFRFPVEIIKEGAANLLVPKLESFNRTVSDYTPSKAPVFYNPLMKLNRDIAILVLQIYQRMVGRKLRVSEPLTGCGVRGIRFAKEDERVQIYLNDINSEACKMAQYNIQLNNVADRIFIANEDANLFLNRYAAPHKRFDYIDLDPFGTPVIYLDSAVRATRDGGMIALTATDLAPLCGVYPKSALRKYGGLPLRTEYCHEIAVRLLAGCLAMTTAKHNIGVDILISHSTNHYIRIYALAYYGAKKTNESIQKMGYILHCFTCFHRETLTGTISFSKERCNECGSVLKVSGPLWLGRIVNEKFCELTKKEATMKSIEHKDNLIKMLSLIQEESHAPITYYVVDKICDKLNVPVPPLRNVIKKLVEKGFNATPTHFHSRGVKTDASSKVVTEAVGEIAK